MLRHNLCEVKWKYAELLNLHNLGKSQNLSSPDYCNCLEFRTLWQRPVFCFSVECRWMNRAITRACQWKRNNFFSSPPLFLLRFAGSAVHYLRLLLVWPWNSGRYHWLSWVESSFHAAYPRCQNCYLRLWVSHTELSWFLALLDLAECSLLTKIHLI